MRLDHIDDDTLTSKGYLTAILEVLDVIAGEKEDSEKRRAVRAALYEGNKSLLPSTLCDVKPSLLQHLDSFTSLTR